MGSRVPVEKRVAERVRALREKQGLSQAELARLAHTSRSQVLIVERGERAITIVTLDAFARALGVPLADLVTDPQPSSGQAPDRAHRLASMLRERGADYLDLVERLIAGVDRAVAAARPKK